MDGQNATELRKNLEEYKTQQEQARFLHTISDRNEDRMLDLAVDYMQLIGSIIYLSRYFGCCT